MNTIQAYMYANDLVTAGDTSSKNKYLKQKSVCLFQNGWFRLLQRNSNASVLQSNTINLDSELKYVKQIFSTNENDVENWALSSDYWRTFLKNFHVNKIV